MRSPPSKLKRPNNSAARLRPSVSPAKGATRAHLDDIESYQSYNYYNRWIYEIEASLPKQAASMVPRTLSLLLPL